MPDSPVNSAREAGSDLHLELSPTGPRRAAVAAALREAVRSGRLAPGTRLPPYRSLAVDLGVARNTVADAYAELVAEGWLTARQGAGTRVAARVVAKPRRAPGKAPDRKVGAVAHNLRQGQPDATSFPRAAWTAAVRRAITAAPHDAFAPGDPQGRPELRRALAEYLARARGVSASPDQIVVCAGFAHGLRLLFGGVLSGPLAVEPYGLSFHRGILADAGVRTIPMGLDESGARTDELASHPGLASRRGAGGVLLTPAHQFPTGGPLHPTRRAAAVDWARGRGGVVLEDDYDGEFRYDREPVGALQGLDPDHVVYLGSVSKSLSPAIRLGWMVLPPHLVEAMLAAKGLREAWTGVTDQLALAEFIASGNYDKHIRRMRQRYRARRNLLAVTLAERAPHIAVTGIAAGLHAVLRLPPGTEASTVRAATRMGVALDGLATFRHPDSPQPHRDGLVVGYATPPDHRYRPALDGLCRALPPPPAA
ncbi:MocR-like pyridoxine biosynthesis transcription factor PdxR [Actinomadura litoris]|uniref:Aminotransferase class I/II-fold pyridoxal phosphate-dependent enzyme n=1 Tax=Actinomadura litoris TaxID=2678616 RepID=A0A7K1KYU7_9ACTN|nr:PLP-dependent aminotransferase family protein [Actinomadura litoris]MUN37381.1 aminotransferase class I/II-fold pyridoxal phosphate-dependent enzyme [Actinomadura litoris]